MDINELIKTLSARTAAHEAKIQPYIDKKLVLTDYDGSTWRLAGVNDLGYLYWTKAKSKSKKLFTLATKYKVADIEELLTRGPARGYATLEAQANHGGTP